MEIWEKNEIAELNQHVIQVRDLSMKIKERLINISNLAEKPLDQEILLNIKSQIELALYMASLVADMLDMQMKKAKVPRKEDVT